jgi:transketolase
MTNLNLKEMANAIRALAMDAVEAANSGHPGMPMGMADVATVLFTRFLKFDVHHPQWSDRDRFILSAGHGSMLLYSLLYLTGYKNMTLEELKHFRQLGSRTAGHPEFGDAEGIETTTGPLGQGFANAVGMALAERTLRARFGKEIVNHFTYVIVGDGCLMEGISQEALSFAGHQKLEKLITLFDDNGITIDGPTSLSTSENHLKRFEAAGWHVQQIDGHNPEEITLAIQEAQNDPRPSFIACKTIIGYGAPTVQNTCKVHGSPLGASEIEATRKALNWAYGPFEIPEHILSPWRKAGERGRPLYKQWAQSLKSMPSSLQDLFLQIESGKLNAGWKKEYQDFMKKMEQDSMPMATRRSSELCLNILSSHIPELLGGSADLTHSNNTKAANMTPITRENPQGNYVFYGIREHGMAAILNGIALHKGLIPYGGTFLTFSDYCRPAIRLSALMKQRVIYVMTHDSIGLGEDGPTHQPVEHLMSLRMIPNLQVFRPADAIEVAECWMVALESQHNPSLLALSRQNLPLLRKTSTENLSAKGGYILAGDAAHRDMTLIATGSEVSLAMDVRKILMEKGHYVVVVSMPCTALFDQQSAKYQMDVLGDESVLKVSIEAGVTWGWEKYTVSKGLSIGLNRFGASAPIQDLYVYFGFTAERIADKILAFKEGKEEKHGC